MDPNYITEQDVDFVAEIDQEDEYVLHCREEDLFYEENLRAIIREEQALT